MPFYIGAHESFAKGFRGLVPQAEAIGGNVFQFFMRNPRGGKARAFDEAAAQAMAEAMASAGFGPFLCHAPYTLNPASDKPHVRALAELVMAEDLGRLAYFQGALYNFHPGSHVGRGVERATLDIIGLLDRFLGEGSGPTVLLETMAGQGTEVGGRFEEIAAIIDGAAHPERLGVCFDTCHVYSAGYDIVGDLDGVLADFDRTIGLGRLRAIHMNDSMMPLGSHRDRHARIGEGTIGLEAILRLIDHPALRDLPFYLETPNEPEGYRREIELLRAYRSA